MLSDQQLSDRLRSRLQSELRVLNPQDDLLARLRGKAREERPRRDRERSRFRRHRLRLQGAAAFAGALIALLVAVLAVVLIGHGGRPARGPAGRATPVMTEGPSTTYAQLRASFAVLRRPQTAADRGWQPKRPQPIGPATPVPVPGSTRLAATLADGSQVFLAVTKFPGFPIKAGRFTYALAIGLVQDHHVIGSVFCGLDTECRVGPFAFDAAHSSGVYVSVVPDGVRHVRWVFPRQNIYRTETYPRALTVNPAVTGNVAAGRVPRDSSFTPGVVAWYGAGGKVIYRFSHGDPYQALRPQVPLMSAAPVRALLSPGGIGTLRFGTPVATVRAALGRIYGTPDEPYETVGTCGADHNMEWGALDVLLRSGRLVGYMYGGDVLNGMVADSPLLATTTHLRDGDTIANVEHRYGAAFSINRALGWWHLSTPAGRLEGTLARTNTPLGSNRPGLAISNIVAGVPGCTPNDP